ncbi:MAG: hypothetical protein AAFX51_20035 [Cyanobacteria bacterium J06636_28]
MQVDEIANSLDMANAYMPIFLGILPQQSDAALVDRISRKTLLVLSDTASACCTISVGILAIT